VALLKPLGEFWSTLLSAPEPFLPFAVPDVGEEEIAAVAEAMRSGWLTTGPRAAAFEIEFAEQIGGGVEAVAVNSATAGLHLALEAAGVGPGDEVIVPTWTFTATAEVVRYLGAEPVLVDIDPRSLNLDLQAAKAAVTGATRAVMPVHFAGLPVSYPDLSAFAGDHGLRVIEDAAHAFPARTDGIWVGAGSSDACVFSFYATKTLTTGEGGMLVTSNPDIARRARTMRLHGISRNVFDRYRSTAPAWHYQVVAPGFKYNMTDTAAALGRVQLRRAIQMRNRRAAIAARYDEGLAGLPLDLPAHGSSGDLHAWHLYVVRLTDDAPLGRDAFIEAAAVAGIGCSVHFIPLHQQPYWRARANLREVDFPHASSEFRRVVSLPLYSAMTDDQADRVVAAVRSLLS
jgi:dTDP-4-amino-4,6-dideoxygalactose transaminase